MIADGAYGTILEAHVRAGDTCDDLNNTASQIVIDAHIAYLEAGAKQLQTNTFLAFQRSQLKRDRIIAAGISHALEARQAGGYDAEVLLTIGPASTTPRDYYRDIERALESELAGVICETHTDGETAQAFVSAWREVAAGCPSARAIVSCSVPARVVPPWLVAVGESVAALQREDRMGDISAGLNCCDGPEGLEPAVSVLTQTCGPIYLAPSAGIAQKTTDSSYLTPASWVSFILQLIDGRTIKGVGGCCGTTPQHIAELKTATDGE